MVIRTDDAAQAHVITSPSEIPAPFRRAFEAARIAFAPFPYAVFTPGGSLADLRAPSTIVLQDGQAVHWFQSFGGGIQHAQIALPDVAAIERRTFLLSGWLRWIGNTQDHPVSFRTEVATACEALFLPFIEHFRSRSLRADTAACPAGPHLESGQLGGARFKFVRYAEESVRIGARILDSVYEPGLTGDGSPAPTILPALLLRTDRELILVREVDDGTETRYGALRSFIPLEKVVRWGLYHGAHGDVLLELSLGRSGSLTATFSGSKTQALQRLLAGTRAIARRSVLVAKSDPSAPRRPRTPAQHTHSTRTRLADS